MSLPEPVRRYSAAEYLALERAAATKSELVNGEIVAMSGASRQHNYISQNIYMSLRRQLAGRPCQVYGLDLRVRISETGAYVYPDVVVACGEEAQFEDDHVDTLLNPKLVVEVLSPSTEAFDRGAKFAHYRQSQTVQDYVLVAQDRALVEVFSRHGADWILREARGLEGVADLPSIGCSLPLSQVYEQVDLTAEQTSADAAG